MRRKALKKRSNLLMSPSYEGAPLVPDIGGDIVTSSGSVEVIGGGSAVVVVDGRGLGGDGSDDGSGNAKLVVLIGEETSEGTCDGKVEG